MIHARKDYQRIQDPLNFKDKGIPKDEPVFLLRAQDRLFVPMLINYLTLANQVGCSREMLQTIRVHIELANLYNLKHPAKVPDL